MTDLATRLEKLPARLEQLATQYGVPGAALAVRQGDELVEAATGVVNRNTGVETTAGSVFQIGSITKVYTTTLLMQLVDEGRVELDAPVREYLPELQFGDGPATATITLRHLLTHQSGIDGDFFYDTGRGDDCLERYVLACAALPQIHPPGALFSYCNAGFALVGRLIEKLRGGTWDKVLRERLLDPIGATRTGTLPEQAILHRAAAGHLRNPETGEQFVAPVWALVRSNGPAGATPWATGRDLLAFARLHLDGGTTADGTRVLSEESVGRMQEQQLTLPDASLGSGWGLGWILYDWGRERLIGHDGGTIGQSSFLRVHPASGLALALLTNGGQTRELARELFADVFGEVGARVPDLPEPAEGLELDLSRYVGGYQRLSMRADVSVGDTGLMARVTSLGPSPFGADPPAVVAKPVDERTFLIDMPGFGKATATFLEFDAHGRPGYVHFGGRAYPRVD